MWIPDHHTDSNGCAALINVICDISQFVVIVPVPDETSAPQHWGRGGTVDLPYGHLKSSHGHFKFIYFKRYIYGHFKCVYGHISLYAYMSI